MWQLTRNVGQSQNFPLSPFPIFKIFVPTMKSEIFLNSQESLTVVRLKLEFLFESLQNLYQKNLKYIFIQTIQYMEVNVIKNFKIKKLTSNCCYHKMAYKILKKNK